MLLVILSLVACDAIVPEFNQPPPTESPPQAEEKPMADPLGEPKVDPASVVGIHANLRPAAGSSLEGEAVVNYVDDRWVWADGEPVKGATPMRLVDIITEVGTTAPADDAPKDLSRYELEEPVARVALSIEEGQARVVLIGGSGPPVEDGGEFNQRTRFAMLGDGHSVYLTGERSLSVVQDFIREQKRKVKRDMAKETQEEDIKE